MMKSNSKAPVYTRESLRIEQYRLRLAIKQQEAQLRQRVQKLPGELLYAGADAVLPAALSGKISDKILGAGRNFINRSIIKKSGGHTSRLVTAAKQAGLFTLLRIAYKALIKRK